MIIHFYHGSTRLVQQELYLKDQHLKVNSLLNFYLDHLIRSKDTVSAQSFTALKGDIASKNGG